MYRCCIIGTGKRFTYFNPIFRYLINEKILQIVGIANKSGKFKQEHKSFTNNLFNNYDTMITDLKPDIVIMIVSSGQNSVLARNISDKFNCKIFVETPCNGINIKNNIHILENWIYLPLEILKKKIIASGILGNIKEIINDHRTYQYHGIAQLRSYIGGCKSENIIKKKNEIIFQQKTTILKHRYPKIKNKKIIILAEKYNVISDCIVEHEKDNILSLYSNKNSKIINADFSFDNEYCLKNIKIIIEDMEFTWNNEFNVNLDQYQYGSLKSIINGLDNNFYTIENHQMDLI